MVVLVVGLVLGADDVIDDVVPNEVCVLAVFDDFGHCFKYKSKSALIVDCCVAVVDGLMVVVVY